MGRVNLYNKYAFTLVFKKVKRIVGYDMKIHPPHWVDECTKETLDEPHKHKFKEGCKKDLAAKKIPKHEIVRNDVNKALIQFFEECNIRMEGSYTPILISKGGMPQKRLFEYRDATFNHIERGEK